MPDRKKIALVVGTRPEAIKVAPVVHELRRFSDVCDTVLLSTGQHRQMLDSALEAFGLRPDFDLEIMTHGQTLTQVTTRAADGLDAWIEAEKPDFVLAQGDTTTTFAAGLVSFYRQIPFGHIEAGLRTDRIDNPFPEEFNRRAVGLVANLHFAPTQLSAKNLLAEGKDPATVFVTGNTVVDAVLAMEGDPKEWFPEHEGRVILLTTHRRENWGEPQRQIAQAAFDILESFPDTLLVVPMHLNPSVRETLQGILGSHPRCRLIEPPEYRQFVPLLRRSNLVLSDSGGVQEEAPAFGLPVLVLRETTERPEGVQAGTAKLVGTDRETIFAEASKLLSNEDAYLEMAQAVSPYGDGKASERIRQLTLRSLGIETSL